MKAGYVIVLGSISYIILTLPEALWVFQYKLPTISTIITLFACVVWIRRKENRVTFRNAIFTKNKLPGPLLNNLSKSIRIGIISGFALLTIVSGTISLVMSKSNGHKFIENEVLNNSMVQERVGKINLVAFTNNMRFFHSFKGQGQELKTNLLVFGDAGQVKLEVFAFKKSESWEIEKVSIID